MTAIARIQVLHDFFAPLVLEIHIDVGRLVPFLGDEALGRAPTDGRIDDGDAEAVAHHGVGRRAPSLTQDARGSCANRTRSCTVKEEVLVAQLRNQ